MRFFNATIISYFESRRGMLEIYTITTNLAPMATQIFLVIYTA